MAGAIESVADLYNALGGVDTVNWLITLDNSDNVRIGTATFGDSDHRDGRVDRDIDQRPYRYPR